MEHILALTGLIEGVKANNLPAIITYIYFKKVFDTIHRGKMLKILRAYHIPGHIVVADMYERTMATVISPDGDIGGSVTGDTLAPHLFVIVLDFALRMAIEGKEEALGFHLAKRRSRRIGLEVVTNLDFADDITLLSEEIHKAQELLQREKESVESHSWIGDTTRIKQSKQGKMSNFSAIFRKCHKWVTKRCIDLNSASIYSSY